MKALTELVCRTLPARRRNVKSDRVPELERALAAAKERYAQHATDMADAPAQLAELKEGLTQLHAQNATLSEQLDEKTRVAEAARREAVDAVKLAREGSHTALRDVDAARVPCLVRACTSRVRARDPVGRKLEFLLHVHFAILPLRTAETGALRAAKSLSVRTQDGMRAFKRYIETDGKDAATAHAAPVIKSFRCRIV